MVNFAGASVCRRCAKPLASVCPECGKPIAPDAAFCAACGTILNAETVDVSRYKNKSLRSHDFDQERHEMGVTDKELAAAKARQLKPKAVAYRNCPDCSARISREATFCTHCGAMFDALDPPASAPPPKYPAATGATEKAEPKSVSSVKTADKPRAPAAPAAVEAPRATRRPPRPVPAAVPPPAPAAVSPPAPPPPAAALHLTGKPRPELRLRMLPVAGAKYPNPAAPKKTVKVDDFYLAAEPVTCEQYKIFLKATGRAAPADWLDGEFLPGKANHPVVMVSLADALAFCRWAGVRLPTPNEWLAACVGADGRTYPWGDAPPSGANGRSTTWPVDAFPDRRGPFGHLCLVGDVQQWLFRRDRNGEKTGDPEFPVGALALGGSSYLDPPAVGANGRSSRITNPQLADYHVGFRCATDSIA